MRVFRFHITCLAACVFTLTATTAPAQQIDAGLSGIASVVDRTTKRASSYDRTGGNLDNVINFEPGQTHVVLEDEGPGKITHMWFTVSYYDGHEYPLRDLVLRMYWENSEVPSVEVPLGDFFGLGHGRMYKVHSMPINVGDNVRALNCYWPMPFYKHAKITITNEGSRSIRRIYYNVDYEVGDIPPNQGLFHAEYRRVKELPSQDEEGNTHGEDNYVILDAKGKGQYLGCFMFVDSAPGAWWGEGDEMIFLDGETKPSIVGTGTEDYFGNAWGFHEPSNFPFYGTPYLVTSADRWRQTSVYRLHIPDPVRFNTAIRVTMEHTWPQKNVKNDYSSVAYWYQLEPNIERVKLDTGADNYPRRHEPLKPTTGNQVYDGTRFEAALREAGIQAQAITTGSRAAHSGGVLRIAEAGKAVTLPLKHIGEGKYRVMIKLHKREQMQDVQAGTSADQLKTITPGEVDRPVPIGEVQVGKDGRTEVIVLSPSIVDIDYVRLQPLDN